MKVSKFFLQEHTLFSKRKMSTVPMPSCQNLNKLWSSFCKIDNTNYNRDSNYTAKRFSYISAEVDEMINNPVHEGDMMYPFDENIEPTSYRIYYNSQSFDEDYDEYAEGYPSDAEDLDDCTYSSEDEEENYE